MKSATDQHWDKRAFVEKDATRVNNPDLALRDLENDFLLSRLPRGGRLLEVGCGNGYLTNVLRERADHVDAFDFSENMLSEARRVYGERNNQFIHDNLLDPQRIQPFYDIIVCVRVLINLRDLGEQKRGIENMARMLHPRGTLFLVEGFMDGFDGLNDLRIRSGIDPMRPAPINFYSYLGDLKPLIDVLFSTEAEFHTGSFDFLTRVIYPALVGAKNATSYSDFHAKTLPVVKAFNADAFKPYARVRGFEFRRRS